jgi:hypothetical protein
MAVTIKGKEYDETKFSDKLKTLLTIMRELQTNRARIVLENEKQTILINHYDKLIEEELKKTK